MGQRVQPASWTFLGFLQSLTEIPQQLFKDKDFRNPQHLIYDHCKDKEAWLSLESHATFSGASPSFPVLLFPLTPYLKMSFNKPRLHFTLAHPEILFRGETKDPVSEDEGNSAGCRWQCGTVPLPPTLLTTCDVEHLTFLICFQMMTFSLFFLFYFLYTGSEHPSLD